MNKKVLNLSIALCAGVLLIFGIYKTLHQKPLVVLPYYGVEGHVIGDFEFIDQTGNKVTPSIFKDKIYVTDYFFTTCKTICPIMKTSMKGIYDKFSNNNDVMFLSHTVDPETDSVEVLAQYALSLGIDNNKWKFVTGNKKELYDAARNYYLLNAEKGDGGPDDFIHTQNFALIDKEKKIRGFYDGTDSVQMKKLIVDIDVLLNEYR